MIDIDECHNVYNIYVNSQDKFYILAFLFIDMKGNVTQKGYYGIGAIVGLYIIILAIFLSIPSPNAYNFFVRFFAITGLYLLAIAVLLTPFMEQIYQEWGMPFQKVHHYFAALGLAAATLHPVIFAIEVSNIAVFVPDLSSLYDFMLLGGRQALIILYIATIAAFVRSKIPKYWKAIHSLMYLMLFFALVHGFMIGTDFANIGIQIIFSVLFIASIVAMIYKRT